MYIKYIYIVQIHRAEQLNSLQDDNRDLGTCILSPKDKSTQPDAFRVSTNDEEYIENQCSFRGAESESCAYEVHPNSRLIYAELETQKVTQSQVLIALFDVP